MSSTLYLSLPDGSRKAVPVRTTPGEVARSIGDSRAGGFDRPSPLAAHDHQTAEAKKRKIRIRGEWMRLHAPSELAVPGPASSKALRD